MNPLLERVVSLWVRQHKRRADPSRRVFLRTMVGGALLAPALPQIIERITVETPEDARRRRNIELLRAMGRGSVEAREAFAAFISVPIIRVIDQAPVISNLFGTDPLAYNWPPVILEQDDVLGETTLNGA